MDLFTIAAAKKLAGSGGAGTGGAGQIQITDVIDTSDRIPTSLAVYTYVNQTIGDIEVALDEIIELQNNYIGGSV